MSSVFANSVDLDEQRRIYVITAGYYSDYNILAATTDSDRAEYLRNFYEAEGYHDTRIEDYADGKPSVQVEPLVLWRYLWFDRKGQLKQDIQRYRKEDDEPPLRFQLCADFSFEARIKDSEYSDDFLKVCQDTRAQMIAERLGL